MNKTIFQSALHFFSGTMVSRISGLARDIAMAFCFGATSEVAAFMVAYRLAFLFRRLFGEGLLSQGFIPHFEEIRSLSEQEATRFFRDVFFTVAFLVLLLCLAMGGVIWAVGKGQIPFLTLLILPGVFFICLYATTMAFLQTSGRFFLPAAAPAFANLLWVFAALVLYFREVHMPMVWLAIVVSLGFALQWAITWIQARRLLLQGDVAWWRPKLFSAPFKKAAAPLFLGILGVAAVQVNSTIDAIFARTASPEGPAFLWYAIRIQQLPLALIGLALSSALLPALSRAGSEQSSILKKGMELTFFLIFPCTVALFVLAFPGVNLLYGHGGFHLNDVDATVRCLWGYGWGLLPAALVLILCQGFYARKDYKTPAIGFGLSAGCNVGLNTLFVFGLRLGPESIALATSAASLINLLFLYYHRPIALPISSFAKVAISAALSGLIIFSLTPKILPESFLIQLLQFGGLGCGFVLGFIGICLLLKVPVKVQFSLK